MSWTWRECAFELLFSLETELCWRPATVDEIKADFTLVAAVWRLKRTCDKKDRLEEMPADESPQSAVSFVVKAPRGKADVDFDDWLSHFELCVDVKNWSTKQRCRMEQSLLRVDTGRGIGHVWLAVSLRGNAQRVFLGLSPSDRSPYETLVLALRRRLQPKQQRAVHKLTFLSRKRGKGESLVNLANDLRHLATRAFAGRDEKSLEEELVDQFVNALQSRELRLGVSQSIPTTLDDAVCQALRLEALFAVENTRHATAMAANDTSASGAAAAVCTAGSETEAPA